MRAPVDLNSGGQISPQRTQPVELRSIHRAIRIQAWYNSLNASCLYVCLVLIGLASYFQLNLINSKNEWEIDTPPYTGVFMYLLWSFFFETYLLWERRKTYAPPPSHDETWYVCVCLDQTACNLNTWCLRSIFLGLEHLCAETFGCLCLQNTICSGTWTLACDQIFGEHFFA